MRLVKITNTVNNEELNKTLSHGTIFVGAFSDTCPHCVNMQSEWKNFISMVIKYKINVTILEINANILSSITNPLINNNIEGLPSLFIIKNNKFIASYNKERTANKFLQFLKKYTSKISKKHTIKAMIRRGRRKHTLKHLKSKNVIRM